MRICIFERSSGGSSQPGLNSQSLFRGVLNTNAQGSVGSIPTQAQSEPVQEPERIWLTSEPLSIEGAGQLPLALPEGAVHAVFKRYGQSLDPNWLERFAAHAARENQREWLAALKAIRPVELEGEPGAELSSDAFGERHGFQPPVASLMLREGLLVRFAHQTWFDVLPRDYLALFPAGAEPRFELCTTIAAPLLHLAERFNRA